MQNKTNKKNKTNPVLLIKGGLPTLVYLNLLIRAIIIKSGIKLADSLRIIKILVIDHLDNLQVI